MFDTARFLRDKFDTSANLHRLLTAYRFNPPSLAAVGKWWLREQVPAAWFPILLVILELEGGKVISITDYVRRK